MSRATFRFLSRKVPTSLVIAVAANAFLGIWYMSKLDSRVSDLEQRSSIVREELSKLKEYLDNSRERLIRVEGKLETILDTLQIMQAKAPRRRSTDDVAPR